MDTVTTEKTTTGYKNKHGIESGHPIHDLATKIHAAMKSHHEATGQLPCVESLIDVLCNEGAENAIN